MMGTTNTLFIIHKIYEKLIDEIKSHLNEFSFNIQTIVWKSFAQIEEINVPEDELTQINTIITLGVPMEALKELNRKIRLNRLNDNLGIIFSNIGRNGLYIFTDFGPNVGHLPIDQFLKTFKSLSICDENEEYFPLFSSIICGLICGQILSNRKQTNQMFLWEISSQIFNNKFESNGPVVVVGLGSLGFSIVKQLVRIGAQNLVLIDSDSVHNYNLKHNLFLKSHIGLKKCEVVSDYVKNVNTGIKVKVLYCWAQDSNLKLFDDLSKEKAVIISAVDNIETKRFLNKVCLNYCLPFIDVGIDCHMFHIQPIVPHLTESFYAYSDSSDPEYPLCVLKSFPQSIDHCIQWSKNKFDNWFNKRVKRADNWEKCINTSRLIFENFFNRKAKQLLFSFPPERTDENGLNFWSDKQMPFPIQFDFSNDLHKNFIILCAQLIARVNNIEILDFDNISDHLIDWTIPQFIPRSDKIIITDPSITQTSDNMNKIVSESNDLKPIIYSRDNEIHLKFIHTLTNLRANMYRIESASISEVNRISNKIIDCFDFTLWTASAVASIELLKLFELKGNYKLNEELMFNSNHFHNLYDLDVCIISEPKKPNETKLSNECYITEWDQWVICESQKSTLEEVLNELELRSGTVCSMIVMDDSISIYLPQLFPNHLKRKKQTMKDIITNYYSNVPTFVTLSVSFESENEEVFGPNIKYIFN